MKRKAEKQPPAPISAFAARKARQQQVEVVIQTNRGPNESVVEPPSKRARHSSAEDDPVQSTNANEGDRVTKRAARRQKGSKKAVRATPTAEGRATNVPLESAVPRVSSQQPLSEGELDKELDSTDEENDSDGIGAAQSDDDSYESPTSTPAEIQNFPLSKVRLSKKNIVYSDENVLCLRIKEKTNLALVGHYDLWVKRGVVSLMGAKIHPSPRLYRVYAPSTHSLPVIKCVSGVDGEAEVEIRSCHSGIHRLRDLSPLYQRIWKGENSYPDRFSLRGVSGDSRRTFSVLYTSADDSLRRHLRPLHLEKKWSTAMKVLSQRGGQLRVLICGPKAAGKSTFSRYLLNHLLSSVPVEDKVYSNKDGVAFLDLDPGQPEFSTMGQVYLAHLRSPFFGPPFTHPSLDGSHDGMVIRAHHIGATSPKDDADQYVLAAMDLMDRYRTLLASYPQCPLIINYPGWIFGQGLEVATWLIRSLGLSDVVYMSEKGPTEVVGPLGQAAQTAMIPLTILPSQPTDFVSKSSAQLRSMQIQSYFHMSHPMQLHNPVWLETPISRTRPIVVDYDGPKQGILGIMVMGSQISPDLLHDVIDGAIVGVVAVESPSAIPGASTDGPPVEAFGSSDEQGETGPGESKSAPDLDVNMDDLPDTAPQNGHPPATSERAIIRTIKENLPYLFVGSGNSTPLDPRASHCLGLALVRSINVASRKLELVTPIPSPKIAESIKQGHRIVLVRGHLDNPNWAISEEYYAARAAERRCQRSLAKARTSGEGQKKNKGTEESDQARQAKMLSILRDRVRRAGSHVPWMKVMDDSGRRQREAAHQKRLWKLKKRAYPGSESEAEW